MDLTILVSSCDKFQDCWEPFILAFNNCWPDCPFPKYIITNYDGWDGDRNGFKCIQVGHDEGWSTNMKTAIDKEGLSSSYILYLQEDYWLTTHIDSDFIISQIDYCKKKDLDYLRLTFPWMDSYQIDNIHAISPIGKEQYAICLLAAIWKRSSLYKLLVPGWSGWDFEANVETLDLSGFKAEVLLEKEARKQFHFIDAVRRGRWTRIGLNYLRKNNFNHLINKREKEGIVYTSIVDAMRLNKVFRIIGSRIIRIMHSQKWYF